MSTTDQRPEAAREELRAFVQRHGWQLVEELEETGSGARNDRPGLRRVGDLARRRQIDVLVTWKLCRVGRSTLDVLQVIRQLDAHGVRFACVSDPVDTLDRSGAAGRLVLSVLAAVAELERERIVENTRRGVAAARRRGKTLGRPRTAPLELAGRLRELRAAGASWRTAAAELGISVPAARRLAEKGTPIPTVDLDENRADE